MDNRKIVRGVRMPGDRETKVPGVLYTEGQEDALAAALPKSRIAELVAKGDLEGDWNTAPPKDPKAK